MTEMRESHKKKCYRVQTDRIQRQDTEEEGRNLPRRRKNKE